MAFERGRVFDIDAGTVLFAAATRPIGYFARLRGLIGRCAPDLHEAWWFTHCAAVHTLGMRFAIDIVHLDGAGRVLRIRPEVKPARLSAAAKGRQVMELTAGAAAYKGLRTGQTLRFVK